MSGAGTLFYQDTTTHLHLAGAKNEGLFCCRASYSVLALLCEILKDDVSVFEGIIHNQQQIKPPNEPMSPVIKAVEATVADLLA